MTRRRRPSRILAVGLALTMIPSHHFCRVPESELAQVGESCRWQHAPVTMSHQMQFPGISPAQVDQIFREVGELWSSVCGIEIEVRPGAPGANIFAVVTWIDGQNGVLADSYLPCGDAGPQTQLGQRYDTGEAWTVEFLRRVVLHEVGHALGLPHAPQGTGAVMEPYLTAIASPQEWDVREMVARYGSPKPKPKPKPLPPTPLPPPPAPIPTPRPRVGKLLKIGQADGPYTLLPGQVFRFHFLAKAARLFVAETLGKGQWTAALAGPNDPGRIVARDDSHSGKGGNARLGFDVEAPGVYFFEVRGVTPDYFGVFYVRIS